jgi:carbon storage regulator
MLILTRKPGESLYIGDVKVTIVELKGHQIRIGIDAPPEIRIYREEIYLQILDENRKAAEAAASSPQAYAAFDSNSGENDKKRQVPAISSLSSFSSSSRSSGMSRGKVGDVKGSSPDVIVKKKRKSSDE